MPAATGCVVFRARVKTVSYTHLDVYKRQVLGRVSGLFGVNGWVRVFSHTAPREGITHYDPVFLNQKGEWCERKIEAGRAHNAGVVLKFAGCDDRDQAIALLQSEIAVRRAQLPPPSPGEYYWTDLEGLRAVSYTHLDVYKRQIWSRSRRPA